MKRQRNNVLGLAGLSSGVGVGLAGALGVGMAVALGVGMAVALGASPGLAAGAAARPAPAQPTADYVYVVGTDFSLSGTTACLDADPPWSPTLHPATVCSDPVVRGFGDLIYVVNRFGCDNIQVIDPAAGFQTVREFSTGPGSNPHDIAFVSETRAFVTRYDEAWLYEVDPSTGAVTDSIDLSGFADADGLPEMDQMAVLGDRLYVTLQRLDRDFFYTPVPPSYLVVIDVTTNTIVDADAGTPGTQAVPLTGTNPIWEIALDSARGLLFIPESGGFGVMDGGVDVVDVAALRARGFLSTEAQLGGDINDVAFGPGSTAYAVISDASFNTLCVRFDTTTGARTGTVYATSGFNIADIEVHAGKEELFLCDRTLVNPGVRVFSTATHAQLTPGPIATGLPPFDLLVREVVSTTAGSIPPAGLFARARPNPFNPSVRIEFTLPTASFMTLDVHDVLGRRVRRLAEGWWEEGSHGVVWDGTDRRGARVPSGVYFYVLRAGESSVRGKLVLAR